MITIRIRWNSLFRMKRDRCIGHCVLLVGLHFQIVLLLRALVFIDVNLFGGRIHGTPSLCQLTRQLLFRELRLARLKFTVQFIHQNGSLFLAKLEKWICRSLRCIWVFLLFIQKKKIGSEWFVRKFSDFHYESHLV